MNSFGNYLEKLGSNFLVSAMVPSLALVIASTLIFDPILNVAAAFKDPDGIYQMAGFGLFVFIFTVIIGFTLTALNTFILKMFEGYVTFPPLRFLYNRSRKIHKQRARQLLERRRNLEDLIHRVRKASKQNPRLDRRLEQLRGQYYSTAVAYDQRYPQDENDILPTRFGNTLKAAENYPGERYGLDGVNFFPRLVQVIPNEYKSSIDATRNELSFLVNMSVLSVIFSMLCVFAFFYAMWMVSAGAGDPAAYSDFVGRATRYLVAAAFGFVSFGFFYNASIFSVSSFGLVIRSSFDLFRLDLLKKLGLQRPRDYDQEFSTWSTLNELVMLGEHSLSFENLDYREKE